MTRKQMKAQAKSLMRNSKPKPVLVSIVYVVILMVIAVLSYKLVGESLAKAYAAVMGSSGLYDANGLLRPDAYDMINNIDFDAFSAALIREGPTPMARLLDLLLTAVEAVIGAGFVIFTLRTIDGSGASYWNLFDGFAMFFRIIGCTSSKAFSFSCGLCFSSSPELLRCTATVWLSTCCLSTPR